MRCGHGLTEGIDRGGLSAIGGGLVGDLLLRIVHIVRYRIDGQNRRVFVSHAGCQCHSGKDSSDQKFDSIHNFNTLFDNYLFIIYNVQALGGSGDALALQVVVLTLLAVGSNFVDAGGVTL